MIEKVILLSPVKDEEWIIGDSLKNWDSFSDVIILADQSSKDKTVEIAKTFKKVTVVKNPFKGYTNEVRFLLLDKARQIPGNNLIVCLDADEQIDPIFIQEIKNYLTQNKSDSIGFSSKWLQLYKTSNLYRNDSPWKNNYKTFCFLDNKKDDYDRKVITNEHIARIPKTKITVKIKTPILHFQFLAKKRAQIKQALYMCNETIDGWDQRKTNNRYRVAKFLENPPLKTLQSGWVNKIFEPSNKNLRSYSEEKMLQIKEIFCKFGTLKFEGLDIWDIPELREEFFKENHRNPGKAKEFPFFIVKINDLKNNVKNKFRMWYNIINEKISREL